MKAGVDIDRVAGHARSAAADEEGDDPANLGDVDEAARGTWLHGAVEALVELRDASRRAPTTRPRLPLSMSPTRVSKSQTLGSGSVG